MPCGSPVGCPGRGPGLTFCSDFVLFLVSDFFFIFFCFLGGSIRYGSACMVPTPGDGRSGRQALAAPKERGRGVLSSVVLRGCAGVTGHGSPPVCDGVEDWKGCLPWAQV